jgi:hypothetical protein
MPFRLPTFLDLIKDCELSVVESADFESSAPSGCLWAVFGWLSLLRTPMLSEPGPDQTAIELPYRLILSPPSRSGFSHAARPAGATTSQRIELWHTRLGIQPGEEGTEDDTIDRPLRAVWMRQGEGPGWSPNDPKLNIPESDEPFHTSMSQCNRADIVHLSGNPRLRWQTARDIDPKPIATRRLALSSLGAWLTSRGSWVPPLGQISLAGWSHRATQGRDHYVRIEELGSLFPFGHLADTPTWARQTSRGGPGIKISSSSYVKRCFQEPSSTTYRAPTASLEGPKSDAALEVSLSPLSTSPLA